MRVSDHLVYASKRWTETGALDHYRYAHAFDHLYGAFRRSPGIAVLI